MHIGVKVEGGEKLRRSLDVLSRAQINVAVSEGLNITAKHMQKAMKNEIRSVFDRPTSYIVNSIWVEQATPDKLSAWVAPTYMGTRGKHIDPQKILRAQEVGGRRYDKRIEVALKQANLLPTGMQIAAPADRYGGPLEGSTDGRGNLRGPYLRKLLAYLKTGWQDVAGAKQKRRVDTLLKRYEWQSNRKTQRVLKLMDGMEFFVSDGKHRSGLGAGIWARKGKTLRCVVAFTDPADYRNPRLNLERIRRRVALDDKAAKWIRGRIYEAAKDAGLSPQG